MEIKEILGWVILIAILLGLFLAQTFIYMDECDVSFLCGVGLTIVTLVVIVVVVGLVNLAMDWLIN